MMWLGIALVIVAVAALLLIWILCEAVGIYRHAVRALVAANKVEQNTRILRAIPEVNNLLADTEGTVATIAGQAKQLADAVS
jgi:hypothetical protein